MSTDLVEQAYHKTLETWRNQRLTAREQFASALQEFRIRQAYHSGYIENEHITYHDTRDVFEEGRAIGFTGDVRTLFELGKALLKQRTCRICIDDGCLCKCSCWRETQRQCDRHYRGHDLLPSCQDSLLSLTAVDTNQIVLYFMNFQVLF